MIRVNETAWVSKSQVACITVTRGKVRIFTFGEDCMFVVDEEYLPTVCSSLDINYATVKGLLAAQQLGLKETKNGPDTGST